MDDVFEFLHNADEQLEKHGNPVEAATKYYEAVYLMRQYLLRIPTVTTTSNNSKKSRAIHDLLQEKIAHYESVASKLLSQPTVASPTTTKGTLSATDNNRMLSNLSIRNTNSTKNSRSPISNCDTGSSTHWNNQASTTTMLEQRNPNNSIRGISSAVTFDSGNSEVHCMNQKANVLLSQAMQDDDESYANSMSSGTTASKKSPHGAQNPNATKNVISKYMEAAELYLQAIQLVQKKKKQSNDSTTTGSYKQIDSIMKQQLQQTLDRIEVLKQQQQQQQSSSNHKSMNSTPTRPVERNTTTTNSNSMLTPYEVQVLKQSSLIASGLFLPWSDIDATRFNAECRQKQGQPLKSSSSPDRFTDPDGFLPLSKKQTEHFYSWARPHEIIRIRQQHNNMLSSLKLGRLSSSATDTANDVDKNIVVLRSSTITPYTIQQKYITDCSFIASLCICANYERKFRKPLVTSILYPQAPDGSSSNTQPVYNPNGKYMVKLWLNGIPRCVIIDDYLPIDKHGNLLCSQTTSCTTSNSKLELWVCLIEKAYMKLCGGYNFPGSNSGIDLFSLTGWIPEQIYFASPKAVATNDDAITTTKVSTTSVVKDHETPSERVWERIYSASSYGDCLITVSTLSDTRDNEEKVNKMGLVSGHSYAVLSVIQTTYGIRLLQIKNPWAQQSWKGRYSCYDTESWGSPKLRAEVGYDPDIAKKQDDGVFWICWDDILHYFKDFYLSWNPNLFTSRHVLHGQWLQNQGPTDDTFNIGENPQYAITLSERAVQKKATLWILVSRHVTKQEQEGDEASDYLTVHIHRHTARKERIWYPGRSGNCILNGCYTNNPHVLVRYDIQDNSDRNLALILSQYKKSNDLNYTLSCYCTEDFTISSPESNLDNHTEMSSTWSTYTAGGPIGCETYGNNPQYSILIPNNNSSPRTSAEIQVSISSTTTTAVNALLVPVKSYGDVFVKSSGRPIIDTGNYRHGFVVSNRTSIPPGAYTLVVSNFHAGQTGFYSLKVSSNMGNVKLEKI